MNFKKSILQFSIRKLSIGVASIAIGSIFMNASIASANTNTPSQRVNSNANTSTISTVHSKEISQNNPIQPTTETKQNKKKGGWGAHAPTQAHQTPHPPSL